MKLQKILPWYTYLPLIMCPVLNFITYYGNLLFVGSRERSDLTLPIDSIIPFEPAAIVIYILSFLFWIAGFIIIARESREVCYEVLSGEQIAKLLCLVIFIIEPTIMVRPEITNNDIFCQLTAIVYSFDQPTNLFPSIHCLESWICFRGALKCKKVNWLYKAFCLVFAVLIFASTVLVKQHVFIDIVGGIAIAEAGLFVSRKLQTGRIYQALEVKLSSRFQPQKAIVTKEVGHHESN